VVTTSQPVAKVIGIFVVNQVLSKLAEKQHLKKVTALPVTGSAFTVANA